MANLMEAYKKRIAVAESVYSKAHAGETLCESKKLVIAKLLENTDKFLRESFENSVGTQRADMGAFKKFSLNLTNVAVPNLIAYDLVIVSPMSSMSGYINYIQFTAGSNKGATAQGDVLNDPFRLGKVDPNYSAARVVETITEGMTKVAWGPVLETSAKFLNDANEELEGGVMNADGTFTAPEGATKIAYIYNNVVIPQNDLPIINAKIESMPLLAKARRIAIYYSQIAAFQAKTDYGFDLGDQLAEKAVGQLQYEIDTEVTQLLIDNAEVDADLEWNRTVPTHIAKAEHYEGFSEIVEIAKQKIYDKTKRFAPNYMLIASDVLPILTFIKGFSAAPAGKINGPYFAGTLNGVKVFVTPNIGAGKFVLGVNGDDMMSSAAVYAPYLPVCPTQLLQYADGGTSSGWSTLYDLKLLNKDLLIAGNVVRKEQIMNVASI